MKVWIDQDLCSGDGLCSETTSGVFAMGDDGVAHVLMPDGSLGNGCDDMALVSADQESAVRDSACECPTECNFIDD
jgi:ferredoxin